MRPTARGESWRQCWCVTAEASIGLTVLDKIRGLAPPVIDRLGPIEYTELNLLIDPGFPKLAMNYWKSCFVADLTDEVVAILNEQFRLCPSTMSKLIVESPHGAALRKKPDATAFPHRSKGFSVMILAQWKDSKETEANIAWARETYERLLPHAQQGGYINYLDEDDIENRTRQVLGANFQRLQALKDRYDPQNILHLNQNIPPSLAN